MTLTHQALSAALERLDMPLPLAEVHGLCCGLLCSMASGPAKTRWFTELLDAASLSADRVATKAAELKTLDEWFGETLSALNDADMDFTPAVPADDVPLALRTRALSDFCGGYTYGVGIALSQRGQKPLPADTREIIEDFQAIEAADDDDASSDEGVYTELLEYVRVGVLLVLEELRPVTPATQHQPS